MTFDRTRPESRIAELERSVRLLKLVALTVIFTLGAAALSAFVVQEEQDEEVQARRVVLMDTEGRPGVVLRAGPGSSLVIESPDGRELMRLGGPAIRGIRQ